jgi:hypothetical protein
VRHGWRAALAFPAALCIAALASETATAAETHVIVGTHQVAWTYNNKKSTPTVPLVVDDINVGDTIEIRIAVGPIPHGFVTIKQIAAAAPSEDRSLVLACGEETSTKPNAVLREISCSGPSKLGVRFTGSMRLEVLESFRSNVDFWCIVHHGGMAGVLKRKNGT